MNLTDLNIHDSQILKVIEDSQNDTIDFILEYPIDYENNIFEKRKLRFYDFLNYNINEIPFAGIPTIIEISEFKTKRYKVGVGKNEIEIVRNFVEFSTNCGLRTIEYKSVELLNIDFE